MAKGSTSRDKKQCIVVQYLQNVPGCSHQRNKMSVAHLYLKSPSFSREEKSRADFNVGCHCIDQDERVQCETPNLGENKKIQTCTDKDKSLKKNNERVT